MVVEPNMPSASGNKPLLPRIIYLGPTDTEAQELGGYHLLGPLTSYDIYFWLWLMMEKMNSRFSHTNGS